MSDAEEPAARFERVVREYGPALTRLAATYTHDAMDRDDLLQEILFALWRALSSFRGESSERTFVYRIAHNRAITFVSRQRPLARTVDAEEIADPSPDAASGPVRAQRHESLMAAVRRLPEPQRQAVMLHLEGLSNAEIADVQGTTEGNVAVRLTRARKALRHWLGEDGGDE